MGATMARRKLILIKQFNTLVAVAAQYCHYNMNLFVKYITHYAIIEQCIRRDNATARKAQQPLAQLFPFVASVITRRLKTFHTNQKLCLMLYAPFPHLARPITPISTLTLTITLTNKQFERRQPTVDMPGWPKSFAL